MTSATMAEADDAVRLMRGMEATQREIIAAIAELKAAVVPVGIERFTTTPQTRLNSTMKNLTTTSESEQTPITVLDIGDASSTQTTPSTPPDAFPRADQENDASPVRALNFSTGTAEYSSASKTEDERGEVGSALRYAADSLEKIGEAADKRIAEIRADFQERLQGTLSETTSVKAELERIRAEKDSAEAKLAKAIAEKDDAETQTIEQRPNINLASRALIQRRCKGFGPELAYLLVAARENIGGFTSWDKRNDQNAVQALRGIGVKLLNSLKDQFDLFPVRNINTASAEELQQAMWESIPSFPCDLSAECNCHPNLRSEMKAVAEIIVEERDFYGEFEDWDDVTERVSRGSGNWTFKPQDAIKYLRTSRVRCGSLAEEEAAAARASNLKRMFNDTSFIRIPECASQLEECNVRRLMALAEHYLIVVKGTPTKSKLVEMILEEERRREVEKFVRDIFDRIIAVEAFVRGILKKVIAVDEDKRGSSDDGERTLKQQDQRKGYVGRITRSVEDSSRPEEVGQVNVRVLGDGVSLARMDTKSQLIPLAQFRYGLDLPKGNRPNKRDVIRLILDHENQVKKMILDRDGKNPNPVVKVWRGEDVLSVGSWNMLTLSDRTLKKGMERSKQMDIVLDGLNQFDVVALLEVFNAGTMKTICGALEKHSGEEWGWVQSRPSKSRANVAREADADDLNEDSKGEIVGFLWRKTKARLTSSEDGERGGTAQTLMQDNIPATSFFHRPPAVARFQSTRLPSFQFVLVAAHVTFDGFEKTRGEVARRKELQNLAGAVEWIRAEEEKAEEKACVWCVGDFNTNPHEDAWKYFKDAGWDTHVQDSTMVLSDHAYDNIAARVQKDDGVTVGLPNAGKSSILKAVLPVDEFILEHPSVTGVRARVGVLNLLRHMERVTKGCHIMLQDHGHDSMKKAVIGAFENTMKSVFRAGVSDHLPVRMQILLPETMPLSVSPKIHAVAGVNIRSSHVKTTSGFDPYPVSTISGPDLKPAVRLPGKRLATQPARQ